MARRAQKIPLGELRNKLEFYETISTPTANGSTTTYQLVYTQLFKKDTNIQRSFFAYQSGAALDNQDCIFIGRKNPNFEPTKNMIIRNVNDNLWYNVLAYQPLEDPVSWIRISVQKKTETFNPVITT